MKKYKDLNGPSSIPVIGNLHQISPSKMQFNLENWADEFGPIYRIKVGPIRMVVLSDTEAILQLYEARPHQVGRLKKLKDLSAQVGVRGVFLRDGQEWIRQRYCVETALEQVCKESYRVKMMKCIDRLLEKWKQAADAGKALNAIDDLTRLTLDVNAQLAFGDDFDELRASRPRLYATLDMVANKLLSRLYIPIPYWSIFSLPSDRKLKQMVAEFNQKLNMIIREAEAEVSSQKNGTKTDLPTYFLQAVLTDESIQTRNFDRVDIFNNIASMLAEAYNTVPGVMSWCLYYLSKYPECIHKIRVETERAYASMPAQDSFIKFEQSPYLVSFIKEVMRLKPPATFSAVEPLEDIQVLGFMIPKGMMITTLHRHIAMQDKNFKDPKIFNPDRWLQNGGGSTGSESRQCPHNPEALLSFGAYPRTCPGRFFSMIQICSTVALICQNFDFGFADSQSKVLEVQGLTMKPNQLKLKISKR